MRDRRGARPTRLIPTERRDPFEEDRRIFQNRKAFPPWLPLNPLEKRRRASDLHISTDACHGLGDGPRFQSLGGSHRCSRRKQSPRQRRHGADARLLPGAAADFPVVFHMCQRNLDGGRAAVLEPPRFIQAPRKRRREQAALSFMRFEVLRAHRQTPAPCAGQPWRASSPERPGPPTPLAPLSHSRR